MGKKNDRSKKMSPQVRGALNQLVAELLKKCSATFNVNNNQDWQQYVNISCILDEIKSFERGLGTRIRTDREEEWTRFTAWAEERGIKYENINLCKYPDTGYGLQTISDREENELLLTVPRKAMLTVDEAFKSKLGALIKRDPILQNMPNVVLSLMILNELSDPSSPWLPYLKILPHEYNTVLYFDLDDIQLLKGSPNFGEAIKMNCNIARQYAYFYRIFNTDPEFRNFPLKEFFTYDNYRWAVSTVMTRQNPIPSIDRSSMVTALIPMWDMCNHVADTLSTDYNDDGDRCECYATRKFPAGSQIFICYGNRSNAEFFLHNGFVYQDNPHDTLAIRLGISKTDELYELKCKLLSKLGISSSGSFHIAAKDKLQPVTTITFLRVFLLRKEQIEKYLEDSDHIPECSDQEYQQIFSFLRTRSMLLLKTYPSTLQEDQQMLQSDQTAHARLATQLCLCEKTILQCHASA